MIGQAPHFTNPVTAEQLNLFVYYLDRCLRAAITNDYKLAHHPIDPSSGTHTGTLTEPYGGTGEAVYAKGDILYSDATNSLARLAGNTTAVKKWLSQVGTGAVSASPVWDDLPAGDHGLLTGLGDDDHTQYHNDTRGDARYALLQRGCPTGIIVEYGVTPAPANWLLCDGAAVSRTTYAGLYAVVADTYGAGDGTTTFNVPNSAGKIIKT